MPRLSRPVTTQARLRFLDQIEDCIVAYIDSPEKPPLTSTELALIAVLFNPGGTWETMVDWTCNNFRYHRAAVKTWMSNTSNQTESFVNALERLRSSALEGSVAPYLGGLSLFREMKQALLQLELPVENRVVTYEDQEKSIIGTPQHTTISEAKIYLSRLLEKDQKADVQHPFRLLSLTAELRLKIYDLVLGLPRSGVSMTKKSNGSLPLKMTVITRDYVPKLSITNWSRANFHLSCDSLYLALLRVNKQIYEEAMPVFYNINTFAFKSILELNDFLQNTGPQRLQFVRHIQFNYAPFSPVDRYGRPASSLVVQWDEFARDKEAHGMVNRSFSGLASLERLQELDVQIREADFFRDEQDWKRCEHVDIPGLDVLKGIRGLKRFELHGDCPTWCGELVDLTKSKSPGNSEF